MNKYNKIQSIMEDMINFFAEFAAILQSKIEAINQNDVTKLEDIMKQEQAFSMKVRGLEKSREAAMAQAGLNAQQFKDIVNSPQSENEEELAKVYFLLKEKLDEYTNLSEVVKAQVELRLHSIKMILERLENNTANAIYDKSGADAAKQADGFKPTKV
ncbi:MAG: flagellar export chaperone FlgN [Oscillospiraceae bacterium]